MTAPGENARRAWTFRLSAVIPKDLPGDAAAVALRAVAARLDEGGFRGEIRDGGGETIGGWEFEPYAEPVTDPLRDAEGAADPGNYFAVGMSGAGVRILNPPRGALSRTEALRLVAWVAVLADLTDQEIVAARRQVERS